MFSKKKLARRLAQKTVSANRRKRMLTNNKKKIIWRNRAFMVAK
jgi:hypothetical protein